MIRSLLFALILASPALADTTGRIPTRDGLSLFYRVVGSHPDTLVAIHGGPGAGMNAILPDFEPLTRSHTVVFYDQRGGGLSSLPADTTQLDADRFVDDLEDVRRYFGIDRLTVVAHSFGAILTAAYAQRYPYRLDRIVFLGATGPVREVEGRRGREKYERMDEADQARMRALLGPLFGGKTEDPVAACRAYEAFGRELDRKQGVRNAWKGSVCDNPPEAVRYYYLHTARKTPSSFGNWDFTTGLEAVSAPVLVVSGRVDSLSTSIQQSWVDAFPKARLLLFDDASKGAIADHPEAVSRAIRAFLADPSH